MASGGAGRTGGLLRALALAAGIAFASGTGAAQPAVEGTDAPVLLRADEVVYDQDLGLITARGNVEISQNDRILLADQVSYSERTDTVTATGNVSLLEPTGEVLFAEYVELTDEMRNGFLRDLRLLLKDDSRAVANAAERTDGNRTVLDRAVYSPCSVCAEDPTRAPLWQVKAVRVIHNQQTQRIDYRDATFELFGVPVFYTPFFRHPDPSVTRESGFLTPSFGTDTRLGFFTSIPYYYVVAPNIDFTVAPIFTSDEGVVMTGQYRHRTQTGAFDFNGSITRTDERDESNAMTGADDTRGHIRGTGRFQVDQTWRWGFDLYRASDDTYLRRYHFSDEDTLTSNAFIEGINGRSYAAANAYSFQGLLEEDDPGITPFVLPLLDYSYVGDPGSLLGGYPTFDAGLLSIYRTDGNDTRRLSGTLGWTRPWIADAGDVYTLTAQLRGDFYWINEGADPTGANDITETGTAYRLAPLVALDWRYPFVRSSGTVQQVIEPIVALVATPYGLNPDEIPNEDSRNFEFDDTNLFALNRFPGLDRVEEGPRLSYGVRGAVYGLSGGYSEVLLGQSVRPRDDETVPADTGLDDTLSDYVGRVTVAPSSLFDVSYRFRLDREALDMRRNELSSSFGPSYLRGRIGYVQLDREVPTAQFGDREELYLSGSAQINRYWQVFGSWRRDLESDGDTLASALGLRYLDECFELILSLNQDNIRDRDIEPSTTFLVRVRLKNLG